MSFIKSFDTDSYCTELKEQKVIAMEYYCMGNTSKKSLVLKH